MNTKISLIRNFVFSIFLVLSQISLANPPIDFPCAGPDKPTFADHSPDPFKSDRLPPYLDGLNLSDSQKDKIAEIVKTQVIHLREKADKVRKAHDNLRKLVFSPYYNEDNAKSFAEAAAHYMVDMAVIHARLDHEVFNVLTAEQQQQIQDNMAKFKEHFPLH